MAWSSLKMDFRSLEEDDTNPPTHQQSTENAICQFRTRVSRFLFQAISFGPLLNRLTLDVGLM